jgi:hypothetical protein
MQTLFALSENPNHKGVTAIAGCRCKQSLHSAYFTHFPKKKTKYKPFIKNLAWHGIMSKVVI